MATHDLPDHLPEIAPPVGPGNTGSMNLPEFPDSSFRNYLAELAAEIVANGNPAGDVIEEMKAAHQRRCDFAREMAAGESGRAKKVRRVLAAKVWTSEQTRKTLNGVFFDLANA